MAAKKTVKKKAATKKVASKLKSATVKVDGKEHTIADLIPNWNKLNEYLKLMDEASVLSVLREEQKGRRRVHMLNRIHARFTKLRSERERLDIMMGKDIKAA